MITNSAVLRSVIILHIIVIITLKLILIGLIH
jgi:hypothetical protein